MPVWDDFSRACKAFGGTYIQTNQTATCTVETHNGLLKIEIDREDVARISGRTQLSSIYVDFFRERVKEVFYSSGFLTLYTYKGNNCSFNRSGKIVYGTCMLNGKIVSFHIDP